MFTERRYKKHAINRFLDFADLLSVLGEDQLSENGCDGVCVVIDGVCGPIYGRKCLQNIQVL